MPAKKNDINPQWIVWGIAGLIAWPIVKGILSAANLAGDILSSPEKLATAMNKSLNTAIEDKVYNAILDYVTTHNYYKDNTEQNFMMQALKKSDLTGKDYLIAKWKEWKGIIAVSEGAAGVISNAAKQALYKVRDFLKQLF